MKHKIESPTPFPGRAGEDANALYNYYSVIQSISFFALLLLQAFRKINNFVTCLQFCICKAIIIAYFLSNWATQV